jgi:methyl-accepting chemotaxis protein
VSPAIQMMDGISASPDQISWITVMIESLAFRTNILDLNASMEAARKGEQGRGFGVVANELRNLRSAPQRPHGKSRI